MQELNYAPYFLTVHEVVRFARAKGILCQGRGSAANSTVCYVLGITAVDPSKHDLLFERFVSASRNEPPDIDVDFEHERREEVIQHIYDRYGRNRAAIVGTVIRYRGRSAIREVGKALGLSEDVTARLSKASWGQAGTKAWKTWRKRPVSISPIGACRWRWNWRREIQDFPRHLATHVGGFVMSRGPLTEMAVIGNAAMEGRTVLEWDKDDVDALKLLKVDILALGMLSCLRRGFDLLRKHHRSISGSRRRAAGLRRDLRHVASGQTARRFPGREPGTDGDAAPAAAQQILRSGGAGRYHPPRTDPRRHGASLSPPSLESGAAGLSQTRLRNMATPTS